MNMLMKQKIMAVAVAAVLMMVGLVGAASAATEPSPEMAGGDLTVEAPADLPLDETVLEVEGEFEDWEPTAEELAEINADTDALVEYLKDKGFEVSVETDELGFRYVEAGDGSEELFEVMDEYYEQLWAEELAGMSAEEKAAWNAEVDAWIAELAAEGITVEKEEIAPGIYDIVWTEEIEEALFDIDFDEGDFDFEGDFEDWEPTAEELAEINADTDALVEYLKDKGFEVSVETDELGFEYVDGEDGSDELNEAICEYYEQLWAEELAGMSAEEKAAWNAEVDAFIAELAAEGITVEKEEIAPGLYDIVWTEDLEGDLEDFELPEEELADA